MANQTKAGAWLAATALSGAAIAAGAAILKKGSQRVSLRGKVALITGGSRGLGLAIAREFGSRGARLALCARDEDELQSAREILAKDNIDAEYFVADISREAEIGVLLRGVLARFGRVDVLVNNAGHIKVGPAQSFDKSEFAAAMDLMFWAPVHLTFAVLPVMERQGSGHIVNITSIGGRVSVPHLLPYSCAKFAAVGFSNGLGAEVAAKHIHVLTVVPGLMRTGSYLNAKFKGEPQKEFAWFGLLGNLPAFSVSAGYAARQIANALERGRRICTISLPAKLLIVLETLAPELNRTLMELVNRTLLPKSSAEKQPVSGKALNPNFGSIFQAFTALGKFAAREFNE
ncbi:MAG TPA: SDR family NAD(P)-dependent oxidoreductase [Bryobacteraceae bacterium]|jgi:short-subunit dehydrogenase|nr:SDR family NAD(P)-dependent oxidoreductase [Bryobacteraceae bacterium]